MSSTAAKLLQAAAEIVGGEKELARRLGIPETLLAKFMAGVIRLPDPLLLKAVDIVLADQHSRLGLGDSQTLKSVGDIPS